jgi:hypothetical protein
MNLGFTQNFGSMQNSHFGSDHQLSDTDSCNTEHKTLGLELEDHDITGPTEDANLIRSETMFHLDVGIRH